jgi:selenocysteine-specific elongation factor
VLDPEAPRAGLRGPRSRARFETLQPDPLAGAAANDRALALLVAERGATGLPLGALVTRGGVTPAQVESVSERLVAARAADRVGRSLFAPGLRADLAGRLERLVREHHKSQPLSEGLPREEARERVFAHADPALFDRVLADLAASGAMTGRDRLVAAGHAVALSPEEEDARAAIERALAAAGLTPPEPAALAAEAGVPPEVLSRVLALLLRQKRVVRIEGLHYGSAVLDRLKGEVRALKGEGTAAVDVASFKDRYGLSRKYAIPLLEYLDRERVTRRQGDARVIL